MSYRTSGAVVKLLIFTSSDPVAPMFNSQQDQPFFVQEFVVLGETPVGQYPT